MTKRLLHLISVRRAAAILLVLSLFAGGVYLSQSPWPNNGPGIQNLTGGLPVSNGQWVIPGEVIWSQVTAQASGNIILQTNISILQPAASASGGGGNVLNVQNLTVNPCNVATNGGYGFGYVVTVPGWLQSVTSSVQTGGFPNNSFYINHYILTQMPTGGTTTTCTANLNYGQAVALLSGAPAGSFYPVSFVGTTANIVSPWGVPGYTTTQTVSNPAAGLDWSFAFPSGAANAARACVQAVMFQMVASATVANRVVGLRLLFGASTPQVFYISPTAQVASQTVLYSFSPGATAANYAPGASTIQIIPFNNGQPLCFNSGLSTPSISTLTSGIQAGDQFSQISILLQIQNDND